ncbi:MULTISPECIES: hypothetical protein [unclassified Niallia]
MISKAKTSSFTMTVYCLKGKIGKLKRLAWIATLDERLTSHLQF